jgi:hypothetical protein
MYIYQQLVLKPRKVNTYIIHTYIDRHICRYIYTYIYIYIYIYIYLYIYTHTHTYYNIHAHICMCVTHT